ncbi:hypothetical protein VC83_04780 [Pseudogymnoascus destructans]|uniref:DUF6594 domain-containing protein n=1 Tax=Pseudogymnoascus destructans TaxID=655981 RepID=A0A177A5Q8_9PEZI|nr:uncharacterized protein VC83_04780 [Pseudogymnoascus destructans]OAF57478.1 hypothetical protein VC83_04780 [Pseudogymnoascus destructans]
MAPRYQHSHSIDAIIESPDEDLAGSRGATPRSTHAISDKKRSPTTTKSAAAPHSKEKSRKSHHRSSFSSSSKHVSKSSKPKANLAKRYAAAHGEKSSQSLVRQHPRHARRDADSDSSSEEEEEEEPKDYRSVLAAARGRLTSPSLLSTMTSLTTATNNSGGSSGSNSTITQASMLRTETVQEVTISGTTEEEEEGPLSPAAPDPPNVFAYLDEDSSSSDEDEEDSDSDSDSDADENENEDAIQYAPNAPSPSPHPTGSETPDYDADSHSDPDDSDHADDSHPPPQPTWLHPLSPTSSADNANPMAPTFSSHHPRTPSLGSASSFMASDASSLVDMDTDRSTSPEHSVKGSPSPTPRLLLSRPPPGTGQPLASPTEAKLAAQMRAAQMRQDFHSGPGGNHQHPRHQHRHTPTPLSLHPHPHQDTQALSPRLPPPSGYDALATHLTTSPPVYRRFATLNHRLLLHMQDELCELESHLSALDAADAASRTLSLPPTPSSAIARSPCGRRSHKNDDSRERGMKTHIPPSSRRSAAQHPSQLDHHRADLLARVGYKMAQYNASLTSFAKTSRLPAADSADVEAYRAFLASAQPVVYEEARFLERGGDLISLAPTPAPSSTAATETVQRTLIPPPIYHHQQQHPHTQRALLLAALASILLPVLMFTVVPNFVGRIAVAVLVAGMLWGMVSAQGGGVRGVVGGGGVGDWFGGGGRGYWLLLLLFSLLGDGKRRKREEGEEGSFG